MTGEELAKDILKKTLQTVRLHGLSNDEKTMNAIRDAYVEGFTDGIENTRRIYREE